jgi:hypothetical protein
MASEHSPQKYSALREFQENIERKDISKTAWTKSTIVFNSARYRFEIDKNEIQHCSKIIFPPITADENYDLYETDLFLMNYSLIQLVREEGKWTIRLNVVTKKGYSVDTDYIVILAGTATLVSNDPFCIPSYEFSMATREGQIEQPLLLDFYINWDHFIHHSQCYVIKFDFESVQVRGRVGTAMRVDL